MVAAMHIQTENDKTAFGLRTTDLRNIAIGLTAAIVLIMVAGQMADSGSASASSLEDTAEKRFVAPTIAFTTVAADGYINEDEADSNGFTVVGWATDADADCSGAACTVTVVMSDSATPAVTHQETCDVAGSSVWTCTFAAGDIAALGDGQVTLTADVSNDDGAAPTANSQGQLDTADPTVTITSAQVNDAGAYNAAVTLAFATSESTSNFVAGDITAGGAGCSMGSLTTISGSSYTIVCTPSGEGSVTINIAASAFTDAASNGNTVATQFDWTHDVTDPTMTISTGDVADEGDFNAAVTLTLTSNQATSNLAIGDVATTGSGDCTLSSWNADSSTVYTVICTPDGEGTVIINIAAGAFTDAAGNSNTASNEYDWTHDVTVPVVSTATVTGGTAKVGTVITVTVAADAAGYTLGTSTMNTVTMAGFNDAGGGSYTMTYTVVEGNTDRTAGNTPISIILTDSFGNTNSAFTSLTETNALVVDATKPTLTITMASDNDDTTMATTGDDIVLTLTASESVTALVCTIDGEATTIHGKGPALIPNPTIRLPKNPA